MTAAPRTRPPVTETAPVMDPDVAKLLLTLLHDSPFNLRGVQLAELAAVHARAVTFLTAVLPEGDRP